MYLHDLVGHWTGRLVGARRRHQGMECFADDVFHVANLETVDLVPLVAVRSSGFPRHADSDSSAFFF